MGGRQTASADFASSSRPAFLGLDLSFMGAIDPHRSWGVAVACVPRAQIVRAASIARPWVTPVVDWQTIAPGGDRPAPTMDHLQTASVALAITWPADLAPRAVELDYLGPANGGQPSAALAPARTITLETALPDMLSRSALDDRVTRGFAAISWELMSGTFFLPPNVTPTRPSDWLTGGWAAGAYAFRVERADGSVVRLAFTLNG